MAKGNSAGIEAQFAQALRLQKAGNGDAALALFTRIVMARPQTAEAHFQIGRIEAAKGRVKQARAALLKALKHRPGERAIWQALGQVTGLDAHEALVQDMIAVMPAEALAGFGAWLRGEGRLRAAQAALRAAVDGGAEAARLPLAQLLRDGAQLVEAEAVLAEATEKTGEIWYPLALLRARLRQAGPARQAMGQAVTEGANPVGAAIDLSRTLQREGEEDAARATIDAAIERMPKIGPLYGHRGQMAQSRGEMAAALADLQQAIALDPQDGEAFRAYSAGQKIAGDDAIMAQCEAALAGKDLPDPARWRMQFAMAKALEDQGRDGEVFAHLDAANRLQGKAFPYDFDAALAASRAQLAVVRDRLGTVPEGGPEDQVYFVTGMPRSGTTLVENVLAAHGAVSAGGELPFMVDALREVSEAIDQGAPIGRAALDLVAGRYLETSRRRIGGAEIFTDKAISSFYRIGVLAHVLPHARFFVLKRDPRDVGLSIYRNMFSDGQQRFSTDLRNIGRVIALHDALVAAWAEMFPDRVMIVDFAAMTAEPEPHIRAIVEHAGLPWDPACLEPHKAKRRVETLSFAQVRQPIYQAPAQSWRRFEAELAPLEEGLAEPIDLG